jgi:serine/threonine protein kinase
MALKKRRIYGPDVSLMRLDGRYVVEKTYRNRIWFVRMMGIALVSWEAFIYSRLKGISGIPKLLKRPDRYTLVTSYMGGENLKTTTHKPDALYYKKLSKIIEELHRRGVYHLDLRNRRNYGIDANGVPYLVDFASCLWIPSPGKLKDILESIDWMGFVKVKGKLNPELINDEEKKRLAMGETMSSLWLPGRATKLIRDMIRHVRTSFLGSA